MAAPCVDLRARQGVLSLSLPPTADVTPPAADRALPAPTAAATRPLAPGLILGAAAAGGMAEAALTNGLHLLKTRAQMNKAPSPVLGSQLRNLAWSDALRGMPLNLATSLQRRLWGYGVHHIGIFAVGEAQTKAGRVHQSAYFGLLAGVTDAYLSNALRRVMLLQQARLAYEPQLSCRTALKLIVQHEGVRGLQRGAHLTAARNGIASAAYFSVITACHGFQQPSSFADKVMVGALAGAVATLLSNPLDTVRTRLHHAVGGTDSAWAIARALVRTEGLAGFMKGTLAGVGRSAPGVAMQLAVTQSLVEMGTRHASRQAPSQTPSQASRQTSGHPS